MSMAILPAVGCIDTSDPGGENQSPELSFEAFEASVYREPGTGIYIVNGDTPITSRRALQDFYVRYVQKGALIVNQSGGVDTKWDDKQKLNLTYCVSKAFGTNYSAVVSAMQSAGAAWAGVANIQYKHVVAEDANCTAGNTNVLFDVNPVTGGQYLARAFFPDDARAARNVMIDSTSFGQIDPYTLTGILRHELGHTLGFRHEHTRKEAGTCFEDTNYRDLTEYDANSVMHYPQCNGANKGDLVITAKDQAGAALLYGAPGQAPPPGPGTPPAGTCAHDACTAGDKLVATCNADVSAICAKDSYCCSTKWDAVCVSAAKAAGATCTGGGGQPPAPSTCAHDICQAGAALDPSCDACAKQVIVADGYCGSTKWDAVCVKEVAKICGVTCQ